MANEGNSSGRVLWYNPNPSNDVPIPNEDLNVYVNLYVKTKGKSVIVGKQVFNTSDEKEKEIKFFSGTKSNPTDVNSLSYLTTNYTTLQSYSLDSDDDYSEMLGIESINIDFNTSMAPMIKIKLIDVRGAAIFSKNGTGKYDFFFQMPYPLFHLELKGYYGYPIEYCLHLIRFNSNFNSQTGNFEIECDFIGYTYALLNDMQMGLLRACEKTTIGKQKFNELKNEYKGNIEILTIEDTIKKISSINDVTNTVKRDEASVKAINKIDSIISDCGKLIENIKTTLNEINVARGESAKIKSDYYMYDVVVGDGNAIDRKDDESIKKFNETQQKLIDTITKNLSSDLQSIFTNILNADGSYARINFNYAGNLKNTGNIKLDYDNSIISNSYILPTEVEQYTKDNTYYDSIKNIITNELMNVTNGYENNTNYFWDFRVAVDKINKFIQALNEEKIKKENIISEKTRKELKNKIGFDSSIRSLFRILTTSVEVFLSTMMEVSSQAENSAVRKTELNKLLSNLNNVYGEDEQNIYPWPEYRAKKEDGSYYEKYLGIDVNKKNVNELMFTEELIEIMIQQAKDDRVYLGGVNGSNAVNSRLWWPISVVDGNIPIGTQSGFLEVNKNPYEVILSTPGELYKSTPDSAKLLMILRGFLLLGFANRNDISNDLITLHAKLEAWNLKNAIDNVMSGNNAFQLKKAINSLTYEAIEKFGRDNVIFQLEDDKFKYSWIYGDTNKTFLPINKGFNGFKFKVNGRIKNEDAIKLKEKENGSYLFIGHDYEYTPSKANDGAIYVNIIDAEKVDGKNHVPNFGNGPGQSLDAVNYKEKFAGKKISYNTFRDAIKNKDNTSLYVNPLDANKSINVYSNIIYNIPYDGKSDNLVGDDLGNSTTLPLFFADIPNGDYYNNIIIRVDENIFGKNKYEYSDFSFNNNQFYIYKSGKEFDYVKRYNVQNVKGFRHKLIDVILKTNGKHTIPNIGYNFNNEYKYSLFGSEFYYSQNTIEAKAFLFLHCFPFQGVVKPSYKESFDNKFRYNMFDGENSNILGLKALFQAHNGLIKTPKIWAAFIGGILWRIESAKDPINFKQLGLDDKTNPPTKKEFLYVQNTKQLDLADEFNSAILGVSIKNPYCGMHLKKELDEFDSYSNIDEVLINLPKQVKNEFINYFKTWVNNEFKGIQKELEIGGGDITFNEFEVIIKNYKDKIDFEGSITTGKKLIINKSDIEVVFNKKLILNNFINIGMDYDDTNTDNNFIMELNPNSKIMGTLLDLVSTHVYIQNINPRIWSKPEKDEKGKYKYDPISITEKKFKHYVTGFTETFKTLVSDELKRAPEEDKEIKAELFNTTDNDDIRLNVYRTLMAIYQKWISGTQSGGFFSQCSVHPKDEKIAEFERNTTNTGSRLIESFRFVDRAYFDIGDKLYINPKTFSELIINNKGATFFDVSNRILSDNNFLFLPLPSFVNFNDVNELKGIFTPQIMSNEGKQGPSFVCVYAGQISNHLDLTNDVYKDDGVYITVDDAGNLGGLPEDFAKAVDSVNNPYEMNVPVFAVNFGQQNQNFFKDIKLDQKEFSETSESLEIIQDISNQGDKTKVTSIGQNLFNVYQKRSYSCEIEMMGNLAIQPLMYFQLNNIPMFKGLYLIIKVSHTVKPNSISTTFKGVRIKKTKTPLVENNTILLNLTNTSSSTSAGGSTGGFVSGGGGGFVSGGVGSTGYSQAEVCNTNSLNEMQYNSGFWMYLTHQQGPTGALLHYEALYKGGDYSKFPKGPAGAVENTFGNTVNNSCTDNLRIRYTPEFIKMATNEPQKFAKAYIESSWIRFNKEKNDLITTINGNTKTRMGNRTKRSVYEELISKKSYIGIDVSDYDLGTYWYIENKLETDDKTNSTYLTMFQLDRRIPKYVEMVEKLEKKPGSSAEYTDYPEVGKLCELYYPGLGVNFKDYVGKYFLNTPQNSSASSSSSVKTNIVIGDSLAPNVLKGISKAGDDTFEILTQLQESGLSAETFLRSKLNNYNVINNKVKNVVVSLGTNGIYVTTQSIVDKITAKLKKLFPNAKLMIVKGTYGPNVAWSNSLKSDKLQHTVNTYYTLYRNKGFYVVNPAIGDLPNAHTYAPIYKEIGADIIANKNS